MGLLSAGGSISRYQVIGKIQGPITDTVRDGLKAFPIAEIDDTPMDKAVGWTSLENPYRPDFEGSSFVIGTYFAFSMRIDKKSIPSKIVKKHHQQAVIRKLAGDGRAFLSRSEKKIIRDHVVSLLNLRIPATPNTYDVLWDYEKAGLWFFSTLKSANEDLVELFQKSFHLQLLRLFPFTIADAAMGLTDPERDALAKTEETHFME